MSQSHRITDVETLETLYGAPSGAAVEKEVHHLHPHYPVSYTHLTLPTTERV